MSSDSRTPLTELLSDELIRQFRQDLESLPAKYRDGVEAYVFEGKPMRESGEIIGLSESRFSQILAEYIGSPHYFKRTKKHLDMRLVFNLKLNIS